MELLILICTRGSRKKGRNRSGLIARAGRYRNAAGEPIRPHQALAALIGPFVREVYEEEEVDR